MGRVRIQRIVSRYIIPAGVILTMVLLIGLSAINFIYEQQHTDTNVITNDITQLVDIFKRINDECMIISFDYQKNPINFLNVEKFVSSEVGPMNLAHPEHWKGPYVQDNPTMQGHVYLVVNTNKGLYITPGEGVELPNGKVVGRDLPITPETDFEKLSLDSAGFSHRDTPLVMPLKIGKW